VSNILQCVVTTASEAHPKGKAALDRQYLEPKSFDMSRLFQPKHVCCQGFPSILEWPSPLQAQTGLYEKYRFTL